FHTHDCSVFIFDAQNGSADRFEIEKLLRPPKLVCPRFARARRITYYLTSIKPVRDHRRPEWQSKPKKSTTWAKNGSKRSHRDSSNLAPPLRKKYLKSITSTAAVRWTNAELPFASGRSATSPSSRTKKK